MKRTSTTRSGTTCSLDSTVYKNFFNILSLIQMDMQLPSQVQVIEDLKEGKKWLWNDSGSPELKWSEKSLNWIEADADLLFFSRPDVVELQVRNPNDCI